MKRHLRTALGIISVLAVAITACSKAPDAPAVKTTAPTWDLLDVSTTCKGRGSCTEARILPVERGLPDRATCEVVSANVTRRGEGDAAYDMGDDGIAYHTMKCVQAAAR